MLSSIERFDCIQSQYLMDIRKDELSYWLIYVCNGDIVETHCYIVITSELILMSKYVAESIKQLIAGCFGHVGLCQLAEMSCTQLFD